VAVPFDRRRARRSRWVFGSGRDGAASLFRHFDGQFSGYAQRLPRATMSLVARTRGGRGGVYFSRMDPAGYALDRSRSPCGNRAAGHGSLSPDGRARPA
jgi:hypothetical protein